MENHSQKINVYRPESIYVLPADTFGLRWPRSPQANVAAFRSCFREWGGARHDLWRTARQLCLSFSSDDKPRAALKEELFGKQILFSTRPPTRPEPRESSPSTAPRSQSRGRGILSPDEGRRRGLVLADVPLQRVQVPCHHPLLCPRALGRPIMVREAERARIHTNVRGPLDILASIDETLMFYHGEGAPCQTQAHRDGP